MQHKLSHDILIFETSTWHNILYQFLHSNVHSGTGPRKTRGRWLLSKTLYGDGCFNNVFSKYSEFG